MELMLLIGLIGIGAAIGLPSLMKRIRHQPMSGGSWGARRLPDNRRRGALRHEHDRPCGRGGEEAVKSDRPV